MTKFTRNIAYATPQSIFYNNKHILRESHKF